MILFVLISWFFLTQYTRQTEYIGDCQEWIHSENKDGRLGSFDKVFGGPEVGRVDFVGS